jgi:hypothetical protein
MRMDGTRATWKIKRKETNVGSQPSTNLWRVAIGKQPEESTKKKGKE